jgi:glycosyltransferase involved in cell wall biosynthesis
LLLAAREDEDRERLARCLGSLREHAPQIPLTVVEPTTAAVASGLERLAPADVVLLSEPCLLTAQAPAALREAAYADTNTASASALSDTDTTLALAADAGVEPALLADSVAVESLRLRPRLVRIVGPCVYLRRDALELIDGGEANDDRGGILDGELELDAAVEIDLAQRCLLAGLSHVAADDAVIGVLAPRRARAEEPLAPLRERYPYLEARLPAPAADPEPLPPAWSSVAASSTLPRALRAARRGHEPLSVTVDGRSLGATLTGTQRHVLELISALAVTEQLRLRVLIAPDAGEAAIERLRALPGTDLLSAERIARATPRSALFHRPQQMFETEDLRVALRLGERLVLNQLDLIAYRNPGYHADAVAWERHRRVTRQSLAAADRVIVFSRHTEADLLSDELAEEQRVRVVPPGLDHRPLTSELAPGGEQTARLESSPFLLCLGTDFRHKNRIFAIRLLRELRARHGWNGLLVFAGTHIPYGSSRALEQDLLRGAPELQDTSIELGAVSEEVKTWLMRRAAGLLYPSVYEGFGLVPLEAAIDGVPSMFAPRASLAEVLPAEAATIVPWDVRLSAERVLALLTDDGARNRQLDALVQVARPLTWERAAEATIAAYRETLVAPVREAAVLARDELARERELRALVESQDELVERLTDERAHAQQMYDELNAEVGFALGLIGPHGSLPEDVQRALLALGSKPGLSRPLYGAAERAFRAGRALGGLRRSRIDRDP